MKREPLDFAIAEYSVYLFYNEDGKAEGINVENMNILSEYLDFIPILHGIPSFFEKIKMVEEGRARIGSPEAAISE